MTEAEREDYRRRCAVSGVPPQMLDEYVEYEAERHAIAAANAMLARIVGHAKACGGRGHEEGGGAVPE